MARVNPVAAAAAAALVIAFISVITGGKGVGAQVHHVVGGDRGWDTDSDLASWSSGRTFRAGDKIWFSYSAAHNGIVELGTMEEYLSCDVTNPIKMYTDGLDIIPLDGEGIRYFVSGDQERCKNGLKLHVEIQPQAQIQNETHYQASITLSSTTTLADGPTSSDSAYVMGFSGMLFLGLLLCLMDL